MISLKFGEITWITFFRWPLHFWWCPSSQRPANRPACVTSRRLRGAPLTCTERLQSHVMAAAACGQMRRNHPPKGARAWRGIVRCQGMSIPSVIRMALDGHRSCLVGKRLQRVPQNGQVKFGINIRPGMGAVRVTRPTCFGT